MSLHSGTRLGCVLSVLLIVGAAERAAGADDRAAGRWAYSTSAYVYIVPDDEDYVQPTVMGDRGAWHAELRYNYEDQDTWSTWVGYAFTGGTAVTFAVTPMVGAVFGRTVGVAPGFRGSVGWRGIVLYSEGEHLLATDDDSNSFFYSWSELTVSAGGVLTLGAAAQKTQAHQSPREIQWGFLLGTVSDRWGATVYVFGPDQSDPTYVISVYSGL